MMMTDNRCALCNEPIGPEHYTLPTRSKSTKKVMSQRDAIVVTRYRLVTHHEDMYVPVGKCRVELLETDQIEVVHEVCWKEAKRNANE